MKWPENAASRCPTYFARAPPNLDREVVRIWLSTAAMTRAPLFAAALVLSALAGSCSRVASVTSAPATPPKTALVAHDERGWQVACEKFCNVEARAKTLEALCATIVDRSANAIGGGATCTPRAPLDIGVAAPVAIKDAALVDVVTKEHRRFALLALGGELGWVFARELGSVGDGTSEHIGVLATRPVDVAGLEPEAIEVRVVIGRDGVRSERLFVCGLEGDGGVSCPLAAVVGKQPLDKAEGSPVLSAGMSGAFAQAEPSSATWSVDVELTNDGFVARKTGGELPSEIAPIVGEHSW